MPNFWWLNKCKFFLMERVVLISMSKSRKNSQSKMGVWVITSHATQKWRRCQRKTFLTFMYRSLVLLKTPVFDSNKIAFGVIQKCFCSGALIEFFDWWVHKLWTFKRAYKIVNFHSHYKSDPQVGCLEDFFRRFLKLLSFYMIQEDFV